MNNCAKPNTKVKIEKFLNSTLSTYGLQKGVDYSIFPGQLRINKEINKSKLVSGLIEFFPQYNFYWETSRILRWF